MPTSQLSFYLSKTIYKRPEVNSKLTYFLIFMNNGKAFFSLNGIAHNYQCSDKVQLRTLRTLTSQKVLDFMIRSKTQLIRKQS